MNEILIFFLEIWKETGPFQENYDELMAWIGRAFRGDTEEVGVVQGREEGGW